MKYFVLAIVAVLLSLNACGQSHQFVDLGLPSGTLWATTNVGADNPWDYGDYFAWGETKPKSTYSWKRYKYGNGSKDDVVFKKYNENDHKIILDPSDDAATVNWGSDWCMPTLEQVEELVEKCRWTEQWSESRNGKNGYEVTGPNGNTIFLPAAGRKDSKGKILDDRSMGYFWSSSLYLYRDCTRACHIFFAASYVYPYDWNNRSSGYPVRPVRSKK